MSVIEVPGVIQLDNITETWGQVRGAQEHQVSPENTVRETTLEHLTKGLQGSITAEYFPREQNTARSRSATWCKEEGAC